MSCQSRVYFIHFSLRMTWQLELSLIGSMFYGPDRPTLFGLLQKSIISLSQTVSNYPVKSHKAPQMTKISIYGAIHSSEDIKSEGTYPNVERTWPVENIICVGGGGIYVNMHIVIRN